MATSDHSADAEPVTDRVHDTSWSANLEEPRHADSEALVVTHALQAIEHTTEGHHVNLVTHGEHGHPEAYLFEALEDEYGDDLRWEFVERCGCGGYVTRVHI